MGIGILLKLAVGVCCALAVFGLAACTPRGAAVGDTQQEQAPAHDNVPGARTTIAFIGSPRESNVDGLAVNALDADGDFDVVYTGTHGLGDPGATARQAVLDAVARRVNLIMISDFADRTSTGEWDRTLGTARGSGIPVVLLNPEGEPQDPLLYAAVFRINDRMVDAVPLATAADMVIRDEPHDREMMVTTIHPNE